MCLSLLSGDERLLPQIIVLISKLNNRDQRTFFFSLLRALSRKDSTINNRDCDDVQKEWSAVIGGGAALIFSLISSISSLADMLVEWLIAASGDGIAQGITMRRLVISALSRDKGRTFCPDC